METIVDTKSHINISFSVPEEILIKEKENINFLKVLYDRPFEFNYRSLSIGGKPVNLNCFHYTGENSDAPTESKNVKSILM